MFLLHSLSMDAARLGLSIVLPRRDPLTHGAGQAFILFHPFLLAKHATAFLLAVPLGTAAMVLFATVAGGVALLLLSPLLLLASPFLAILVSRAAYTPTHPSTRTHTH